MLNILGNDEFRVLNFGYVMAIDLTIMYINTFSMGFGKSYGQTHLILLPLS